MFSSFQLDGGLAAKAGGKDAGDGGRRLPGATRALAGQRGRSDSQMAHPPTTAVLIPILSAGVIYATPSGEEMEAFILADKQSWRQCFELPALHV